jgi:hypothetical protein
MYDHIQQDFFEAELAYRRGRLQRGFAVHRPQHSLIERVRGALREHRNPVRGATRYQLDGPLTRRVTTYESHRIIAAPRHGAGPSDGRVRHDGARAD